MDSGALTYKFKLFRDGAGKSNYTYAKSIFLIKIKWNAINMFRTLQKQSIFVHVNKCRRATLVLFRTGDYKNTLVMFLDKLFL